MSPFMGASKEGGRAKTRWVLPHGELSRMPQTGLFCCFCCNSSDHVSFVVRPRVRSVLVESTLRPGHHFSHKHESCPSEMDLHSNGKHCKLCYHRWWGLFATSAVWTVAAKRAGFHQQKRHTHRNIQANSNKQHSLKCVFEIRDRIHQLLDSRLQVRVVGLSRHTWPFWTA